MNVDHRVGRVARYADKILIKTGANRLRLDSLCWWRGPGDEKAETKFGRISSLERNVFLLEELWLLEKNITELE